MRCIIYTWFGCGLYEIDLSRVIYKTYLSCTYMPGAICTGRRYLLCTYFPPVIYTGKSYMSYHMFPGCELYEIALLHVLAGDELREVALMHIFPTGEL